MGLSPGSDPALEILHGQQEAAAARFSPPCLQMRRSHSLERQGWCFVHSDSWRLLVVDSALTDKLCSHVSECQRGSYGCSRMVRMDQLWLDSGSHARVPLDSRTVGHVPALPGKSWVMTTLRGTEPMTIQEGGICSCFEVCCSGR